MMNGDDDNNDSDSDSDNDDYILPKILLGKPVALLPNLFVPDNQLLSMNFKVEDDGQDDIDDGDDEDDEMPDVLMVQ